MDKNNFSEIYKKYVMTAYSAAMQVVHNEADADDIAQETMVKLYLNIDALDEDRVEGWVRVAAKNLGIDYQRKAQRFDWNELDEDLRAEEMELPTLAEEEKQERNHFFQEVMDALKDHDESGYYITREIKVHERSEKEVASEMGITIGNLRVKMTRTKNGFASTLLTKPENGISVVTICVRIPGSGKGCGRWNRCGCSSSSH